jgi:hypothetical protein
LIIDGDQLSASRSGCITPGEEPQYVKNGVLERCRVIVKMEAKIKSPLH